VEIKESVATLNAEMFVYVKSLLKICKKT